MIHWKSILDSFPIKQQEVIVYFKNEAGWHVTACYWDGMNFTSVCEECGDRKPFTYKTPITHWTELPQPPNV